MGMKKMVRKACKMKLIPGNEKEYERRHAEIWHIVKKMIKDSGISNYSIYWDKETNYLFSYMEVEDENKDTATEPNEIRYRWWEYMKDIMETNENNSPVSMQMMEVFHID